MRTRDTIAAALSRHRYQVSSSPRALCSCGHWEKPTGDESLNSIHERHLADVLASVVPEVETLDAIGEPTHARITVGGVLIFDGQSRGVPNRLGLPNLDHLLKPHGHEGPCGVPLADAASPALAADRERIAAAIEARGRARHTQVSQISDVRATFEVAAYQDAASLARSAPEVSTEAGA